MKILNRLDSGYVGYESNSGRYASFFLGEIYRKRDNPIKAKEYYERSVNFGLDANAEKMGYHLYSLLNLGKIAFEEDNDDDLAREYFKRVKKLAKGKHPSHKLASRYLKEMKKL